MTPPRLELRSLSKRYPGVIANDDISLTLMPGEIHAVLGENGAGKSTLMKMIYGAVHADSGEILLDGKPVVIRNPAEARQMGIGMVYQHFSLFESISVVENIAVALAGPFDLAQLSQRIVDISEKYGLPVDPKRLVHHLSVGERQRVEIIRCLLQNPRVLILDEPTSVLTPQAVRKLFDVLRVLASEGCSILYISHKLDEIQELCTHATVLRSGRVAGTASPQLTSVEDLARLMVGSSIPHVSRMPATTSVAPRFEVIGLSADSDDPFGTKLDCISLQLRGGEILGIAGVSGNGQAELLSLLSGERPADNQMIWMDGEPVGDRSVSARRKMGLAFVPEERLGRGAVPAMSLSDNSLLTHHGRKYVRNGLIDHGQINKLAQGIIEKFNVKCRSPQSPARTLSGGNLQKFIMGREIGLNPNVLIVSQPTWGVDVAAAQFIRQWLVDLSRAGTAILVISEELDELFEISDRLCVLYQGRLSAPMDAGQVTLENIGLMMAGADPSRLTAA
jgi:simple sugar transport system ATP-binding protein